MISKFPHVQNPLFRTPALVTFVALHDSQFGPIEETLFFKFLPFPFPLFFICSHFFETYSSQISLSLLNLYPSNLMLIVFLQNFHLPILKVLPLQSALKLFAFVQNVKSLVIAPWKFSPSNTKVGKKIPTFFLLIL